MEILVCTGSYRSRSARYVLARRQTTDSRHERRDCLGDPASDRLEYRDPLLLHLLRPNQPR